MHTIKIKVKDDLHPEDNAMLQALYSRSPASVDAHLAKIADGGSDRFMGKYYVGYGHASIGDCGSTTLFIEGVTMLVAKAIQDWPLYSGQESSTRYMDFATAHFHNPTRQRRGEEIQERWRNFYMAAQAPLREHLLSKYPRQEGEVEVDYDRAISARMFDVLRAFLPAGASTNLSWHTNLRQASDHLAWLHSHPDEQARLVADLISDTLIDAYPSSFRGSDGPSQKYYSSVMDDEYFVEFESYDSVVMSGIEEADLYFPIELIQKRPRGAPLPWFFAEDGLLQSSFNLDFGSFRDLQRHRNGVIRMPLLTMQIGFHPWYLDELPTALRTKAEDLLAQQEEEIVAMNCLCVTAQNYIAMGYQVPCRVTQSLPAFVYRLELRSSKTVHPTLRAVVLEEIRQFRGRFPGITLHVDEDPDSWTIRRGKQTIEER